LRRRGHGTADIVRIDEALSPERLAISDEQLHRLPDRAAFAPIEHCLFSLGQFHAIHRSGWARDLTFKIMNEPASKCRRIDLVYAPAAGQIKSMRRGRSHGDAGTHDTNA
jgi:hypothetical protein